MLAKDEHSSLLLKFKKITAAKSFIKFGPGVGRRPRSNRKGGRQIEKQNRKKQKKFHFRK